MSARPESPFLRTALTVVRRRGWLIALCVLSVPIVAILLSARQDSVYEASAEVLLNNTDLAAGLTGTQSSTFVGDAERVAATQARVARAPEVAADVLEALGLDDRSAEDLLAASSVVASDTADVLEFTVSDSDGALAARLVDEYTLQYIAYRGRLDTAAVDRARQEVIQRIGELEAGGQRGSPLHASLLDKEQQLSTLQTLRTAGATLLRPADGADQVEPTPARNGALGLGLGLMLGLGLAFLWEALDTRVRSSEDAGAALGQPLLSRLPTPPGRLRDGGLLAMRDEPGSAEAEPFRVLRTNLELVSLQRRPRTIMVTSATEGEGKSTTVANLAIALARAGRHVVLVDLDLRRPALGRLFGLLGPGVGDVVLGDVPLDDALVDIPLDEPSADGRTARPLSGGGYVGGVLEVLPSGPVPPNPGEFVGSPVLVELLGQLRGRADLVLIDSPPALRVGDSLALSAHVDAILFVARLNALRRSTLEEIRRVLDASPAQKLGFVLTGAESEDGYGGYGGGAGAYRSASAPREPVA